MRYAVVLTTCAGLWGYAIGDTVRFERGKPLGLHFAGRVKDSLSAFGEHLIGDRKVVSEGVVIGGRWWHPQEAAKFRKLAAG